MSYRKFDTPLPLPALADVSSLIEDAVEGIFRTSPEGRYLIANRALAVMYRYDSVQEMLASLTDISNQLYVDPQRRQLFRFLLSQQDVLIGFEAEVYRKDRTTIWVREKARVVRSPSGQVLWYEGFVENITDERRSRQEMARWERAIGSLQDGLAVFSSDGQLVIANAAFLAYIPADAVQPTTIGAVLAALAPCEPVTGWHEKRQRWFSLSAAFEDQVMLSRAGLPPVRLHLIVRPVDKSFGITNEIVVQLALRP
jgi:PAS domain S-box-containing protein